MLKQVARPLVESWNGEDQTACTIMTRLESGRDAALVVAEPARLRGHRGDCPKRLAVAGDPLSDLTTLTAVSAVFRAGVRVR
jgi:hypothetical protein